MRSALEKPNGSESNASNGVSLSARNDLNFPLSKSTLSFFRNLILNS
jgi:hypothetical protein